jgi:hypothetical protein
MWHVQVGHRCHCLLSKEKERQNFRTWQRTLDIHFCIISIDFSNGVSVSADMTIYSPWFVNRCFITEYPSPKVTFISYGNPDNNLESFCIYQILSKFTELLDFLDFFHRPVFYRH